MKPWVSVMSWPISAKTFWMLPSTSPTNRAQPLRKSITICSAPFTGLGSAAHAAPAARSVNPSTMSEGEQSNGVSHEQSSSSAGWDDSGSGGAGTAGSAPRRPSVR